MNLRFCSLSKSFDMSGLFRIISNEIEAIRYLEEIEFIEKEKAKEEKAKEEECVICMCSIINENNENNEKFTTSCNHIFHKDCLTRWCQQKNSCPSCRTINILPCQAQCLPSDSPISVIHDTPFYHILDNEYWQGPDTTPPRSGRPYFNNIINNNYNNNINNINNNNYNNINNNNNYTGLINVIDNININENNI